MHQIDVMVEKKRLEWQHQIHGIQSQCEQKDRELTKLRETVEYRNKEVWVSTYWNFFSVFRLCNGTPKTPKNYKSII